MTIGIDANWLIHEQAGIGKYSYYLIRELLRQDKDNNYILFANFYKNYESRKKILQDLVTSSGNEKTEIYISRFPSAWRDRLTQTQISLKLLYRKNIDLYFSPYFGGIPKRGFPKQAVVLYDMVFSKYPEHAGETLSNYYFNRTKQAIENSELIFAISESTKNDLYEYFDLKNKKMDIIYPGVDREFFSPKKGSQDAFKKYKIDSPYLLSVCTLEPRKNLEVLLDAYNLLPKNIQNNYKLVLAGGKGWNNESLMKKIDYMAGKNQVIRTGYVVDEDLPYLYSGADLFVYPSLYEGFGMPPLEAMACGCPVITSNVSSLPEVVGKNGLTFDPTNKNELGEKISLVIDSSKIQNSLREDGLRQAQKFTWADSAKKLLRIITKN